MADLGELNACKTVAPDIDVHMSTQTGITNWAAARAAYNLGAKRVVLAREMSLQDIAILRDKTPPELEIEAFVHGAMCMSVSGRCLLSNYMAGRDANRGQCAQPCRWKYYLSEETRPGQLYEIGENENGSYILNANDLCTAPFIDLICKAGVDSLKIEGRAKTFYYVASVTAAYRKALDAYLADPANDNFELPAEVYEELTRTSHRHYSPGFYFGREQAKQATDSATYIREWEFVGTVDRWENGVAHCQQRGKWSLGRYAGSPLPGRPQHPADAGVDRERGRGTGGQHPSRHGKIHHAHPGAAAHEPAAPQNGRISSRTPQTMPTGTACKGFAGWLFLHHLPNRTNRAILTYIIMQSERREPDVPAANRKIFSAASSIGSPSRWCWWPCRWHGCCGRFSPSPPAACGSTPACSCSVCL